MTRQLQQATRIAELRERRAKRARREAKSIEAVRTDEAQRAHDAYQDQKAQRKNAEFMLIENPADPQALLWRNLTEGKCDAARADRADAYERLKEARTDLARKRTTHERAVERESIIAAQLKSSLAAQVRRRDVIADEEAQEQHSS